MKLTASQILAQAVDNLNNDLTYTNSKHVDFIENTGNVVLPIFWSEDNDNNISYDIDSIRQNFEQLLTALEQHNEEGDFDWDNSDEFIAEES